MEKIVSIKRRILKEVDCFIDEAIKSINSADEISFTDANEFIKVVRKIIPENRINELEVELIEKMSPESLIAYMVEKDNYHFGHCVADREGITVVEINDKTNGYKTLARWGGDFVVAIENGKIIKNTLVHRAWNYDREKALEEANHAILYFARQMLNDKTSLGASFIDPENVDYEDERYM